MRDGGFRVKLHGRDVSRVSLRATNTRFDEAPREFVRALRHITSSSLSRTFYQNIFALCHSLSLDRLFRKFGNESASKERRKEGERVRRGQRVNYLEIGTDAL